MSEVPVGWATLGQRALDAVSASKSYPQDPGVDAAAQRFAAAIQKLAWAGKVAQLQDSIAKSEERIRRMRAELHIYTDTEQGRIEAADG